MVEPDHFYCFACGEHGDVFTWLEKTRGFGFRDAVMYLAAEHGVVLSEATLRTLTHIKEKRRDVENYISSFQKNVEPAYEYLRNRGLTDDIIRLANVGYDAKDNAVVFPFYDLSGRPVGITKRFIADDAKVRYKSYNNEIFELRNNVWGLSVAIKSNDQGPLYITEGQIDCMSLWQMGIRKCVAYVCGCPTQGQIEQINKYFSGDLVIVPDAKSDNDWELFERVYKKLIEIDPDRSYYVTFPSSGDANDALRRGETEWARNPRPASIVRAERIIMSGACPEAQYRAGRKLWQSTADTLVREDLVRYFAAEWGKNEETVRKYFEGDKEEVAVDLSSVRAALSVAEEQVAAMLERKWHLGFTPLRGLIPHPLPGKLMGVVARPTVGKTTFIINMIRKMRSLKLPTIVISYEQAAYEMAIKLCLCTAVEMGRPIRYQDIYTHIVNNTNEWKWMRDVLEQEYSHVQFCETDPAASDLGDLVHQYGLLLGEPVQLVILDYLNLIPIGIRSESLHDMTLARMEMLKAHAKNSSAFWIFLHHTARSGSRRGDEELGLDAGKGSSSVEDMSDYLLTMWRGDKSASAVEVRMSLIKNKSGRPGKFSLYHQEDYAFIDSTVLLSEGSTTVPVSSVGQEDVQLVDVPVVPMGVACEGDPFEGEEY